MSHHGCPERLSSRAKGFGEESGNQTMEVLVETLTGTAFEMTVSPSDTVLAIKSKICRVEGIPVSQQHLLYNLQELDDNQSLSACGVSGGARLRLVLGLRGGPVATRRLPPPRLTTDRDEDWILGCGSGQCRVTVLVLNDGRRVNMLRVRRHKDKYSSLPHLAEAEPKPSTSTSSVHEDDLEQNAVTMNKMAALRRRLEDLSLRRRPSLIGDGGDIQKTRSEEMLSTPSHAPFADSDESDTFQLCDGHYTRYDYGCTFADRYTLLPPLSARAESAQSVAPEDLQLADLSDTLAGSILVKGHHEADEEAAIETAIEAAILEECLDGVDDASLASQYGDGPLWVRSSWRSASSLTAQRPAPPQAAPTLQDLLFSSSTSDLENLKRNRILPALSRHRNREHLHLSDEGLNLRNSGDTTVGESIAAGESTAAGESIDNGERRQRRIEKIAEMDQLLLSQEQNVVEVSPETGINVHTRIHFSDLPSQLQVEVKTVDKPKEGVANIEKKVRIRCGFCRKRLSIATVHTCRCGAEFCAPHRYAEVHGCAYDYKANGLAYLQRANPLVSAPKLPKI